MGIYSRDRLRASEAVAPIYKTSKYNFLCLLYVTWESILYDSGKALVLYDWDTRILILRLGWTTSILGYPAFILYYSLDSTVIGALGSAYYRGAVIGMVLNGFLPDRIERLRSIQIAMQTDAPNIVVFCTDRIFGGYASRIIFSLAST